MFLYCVVIEAPGYSARVNLLAPAPLDALTLAEQHLGRPIPSDTTSLAVVRLKQEPRS